MSVLSKILKKWYLILLCGIICSVALYAEKKIIKPPVIQTGQITFTEVVRFKYSTPIPDRFYLDADSSLEINRIKSIKPILGMWGDKKKFIEETGGIFDYLKFNPEWNRLKKSEKYAWISNHLKVTELGNNAYEFALRFEAKEAKNYDYVLKNGSAYLESYVNHAKSSVDIFAGRSELEKLESNMFMDEEKHADESHILIKYAILGFILGSLASTAVIGVISSRKSN